MSHPSRVSGATRPALYLSNIKGPTPCPGRGCAAGVIRHSRPRTQGGAAVVKPPGWVAKPAARPRRVLPARPARSRRTVCRKPAARPASGLRPTPGGDSSAPRACARADRARGRATRAATAPARPGNGVSRRARPAKTSGRPPSKKREASSMLRRILSAASNSPRSARPCAISELSWGQTVPLWYASGR